MEVDCPYKGEVEFKVCTLGKNMIIKEEHGVNLNGEGERGPNRFSLCQ